MKTDDRRTTLLLFIAVGVFGIALFLIAACADPYRGHHGLPSNHPDGPSMEVWLQNDGDPPWWPQPCVPKKIWKDEKTEIPKLTDP